MVMAGPSSFNHRGPGFHFVSIRARMVPLSRVPQTTAPTVLAVGAVICRAVPMPAGQDQLNRLLSTLTSTACDRRRLIISAETPSWFAARLGTMA